MFNPLKMAGDLKGMEKMLKPALEKFMKESGFVKQAELEKLEQRGWRIRKKVSRSWLIELSYLHKKRVFQYHLRW